MMAAVLVIILTRVPMRQKQNDTTLRYTVRTRSQDEKVCGG